MPAVGPRVRHLRRADPGRLHVGVTHAFAFAFAFAFAVGVGRFTVATAVRSAVAVGIPCHADGSRDSFSDRRLADSCSARAIADR